MTSSVMEEGHIYVLSFSDKTIKVGRTTDANAASRTASHKKVAQAQVVDRWISEQHGDSNHTEKKLIEFCHQRGRLIRGKEWFSGVSFPAVQQYAEGIEKQPPRKTCYCGKHVIPADSAMPRRQDLDGFLRKDLGLILPPLMEMVFPGEEQFCTTGQMDEVQKILTRHLTAKADFEFFLSLAMNAWKILQGIENEMEGGRDD